MTCGSIPLDQVLVDQLWCMELTPKKEKNTRLSRDAAAQDRDRATAALKLI